MEILTSQFRFTFCFGPYRCIYAFASQDDFVLCTLVYPMNMVLSSIYHEHSSTWSLCEHSPIFYKLSVFSICNSGPSKVHHVSSSDQHPSYLMPTMPIHMVKVFHLGRQENNLAISFLRLFIFFPCTFPSNQCFLHVGYHN